jgi:diguanylate cyclase (GGDEF)-like protein
MLQWQPLALLFVASTVASMVAASILWRHRSANAAAGALTLMLVGTADWSAAVAAGTLWADLNLQLIFSALTYPGICAVVAGFFCHSFAIADRGWRLSRRRALLLLIEPVLALASIATNPVHHLFFTKARLTGSPALLAADLGPLFWLHTFYSYALLASAILMVVRAWIHAPDTHRRRLTWPLLGMAAPLAANITGIFILRGIPIDLTPVGFFATAVCCYWARTHDALPDLVPIARRQVLDTIGEAVVVIDRGQRILDLNPAADELLRRLTPGLPERIVGLIAPEVLGVQLPLTTGKDVAHSITAVMGRPIDLDLRVSFVADRKGTGIGWILVARDVSRLNRQQRELEAANGKLRDQLTTIERLRDDLAEQAVRDALTGLYNRRHLGDALEQAVAHAAETSGHLSVIMLDIDHFKNVNDRYGHAVGDNLIVAVAGQLTAAVRRADTVARYGGEEFVIVLPESTLEQALARAETLRERCAAIALPTVSGTITATISAGVATFTGRESPSELLNAADQALYLAKADGRNRVALAATA